jgi:hypothetical protein
MSCLDRFHCTNFPHKTGIQDVDIINPPYGRNVAIGYSGVTGSQSSIFSFTNAGFEMSALQGNTFDREYTAALICLAQSGLLIKSHFTLYETLL